MGLLGLIRNKPQTHWIEKANTALLKGDGRQAETALLQILKVAEPTSELNEGLLQAYLLQGKSEEALTLHSSLSPNLQKEQENYMLVALGMQVHHIKPQGFAQWLRLEDEEEAERLLLSRRLAKRFDKCCVLVASWAKEAISGQEVRESSKALKQLRDAKPKLSIDKVIELHRENDRMMLKKYPQYRKALEEASNISDASERCDFLLPTAKQAINVAPVQHAMGLSFFQSGKMPEALRFLARATDLNPFWEQAWSDLAVVSLSFKRLIRAQNAFARAFELGAATWHSEMQEELKGWIGGHTYLPFLEAGLARLDLSDLLNAIEPMQIALSYQPKNTKLRVCIGRLLLRLGRSEEALVYLLQVWESKINSELRESLRPDLEKCIHFRVIEALSTEDKQELTLLFQEFASLEQDFSFLQEDRQLFHRYLQGQLSREAWLAYDRSLSYREISLEEQEVELRRVLQMNSVFPEASLALFATSMQQGDLASASSNLEIAARSALNQELLHFHKASLAYLQGQEEEALSIWKSSALSGSEKWQALAKQNVNVLTMGGARNSLLLISLPRCTYYLDAELLGSDVRSSDSFDVLASSSYSTLFASSEKIEDNGMLTGFDLSANSKSDTELEMPAVPLFEVSTGSSAYSTVPPREQFFAENTVPKLSDVLSESGVPKFSDISSNQKQASHESQTDSYEALRSTSEVAIPKENPFQSFKQPGTDPVVESPFQKTSSPFTFEFNQKEVEGNAGEYPEGPSFSEEDLLGLGESEHIERPKGLGQVEAPSGFVGDNKAKTSPFTKIPPSLKMQSESPFPKTEEFALKKGLKPPSPEKKAKKSSEPLVEVDLFHDENAMDSFLDEAFTSLDKLEDD